MAVRTAVVTHLDHNTMLVEWTGLATGDTGQPFEFLGYGDLTVTFEGTFAGGSSVTLEGSNDGTNYYACTDPQGNPITKLAGAMEAVTETPRWVRPSVASGAADSVQCRILARR
jgi:hypothetical protein